MTSSDEQLETLEKVRTLRADLLSRAASNFTVGEIGMILREPHFSTAEEHLEALIKISSYWAAENMRVL